MNRYALLLVFLLLPLFGAIAQDPVPLEYDGQPGYWVSEPDFDFILETLEGYRAAREALSKCNTAAKQSRAEAIAQYEERLKLHEALQKEERRKTRWRGVAIGTGIAVLIETAVLTLAAILH